jgi:peptidoglycan/xylan/chitin deacetylase (PgdA/CDA1 family)
LIFEEVTARVGVPPAVEEMVPLSWEMISEMHLKGMTIGSHSRTHAMLTNEDWSLVIEETWHSRQVLQRRIGEDVRHFAYPDGRVNRDVVDAVEASGYQCAYNTCRYRDTQRPHLTIPRRVLWENSCTDSFGRFSSAIMSCQINGVFDIGRNCEHDHVTRVRRSA